MLWIAAAGLGILNGIGQVLMRAEGGGQPFAALLSIHGLRCHPVWWAGLVLGWCCGLSWACLVTRVSLYIAIPLNVGFFFATTALGSYVCLGEPMTLRQGLGFILVLAGIALIIRPS